MYCQGMVLDEMLRSVIFARHHSLAIATRHGVVRLVVHRHGIRIAGQRRLSGLIPVMLAATSLSSCTSRGHSDGATPRTSATTSAAAMSPSSMTSTGPLPELSDSAASGVVVISTDGTGSAKIALVQAVPDGAEISFREACEGGGSFTLSSAACLVMKADCTSNTAIGGAKLASSRVDVDTLTVSAPPGSKWTLQATVN
jgi:hypothetical protein